MKQALVLALLVAAGAAAAQGSHYRSGYVTKSGVYVPPSYATNPDGSLYNNYSTRGNVNPYTGRAGTADPLRIEPYRAPTYRSSTLTPMPTVRTKPLGLRSLSLLDDDD